jgi:hypothetical protein
MELKIFDRITNRMVQFFGKFDVNLRYDSVGSDYSFEILFDPTSADHKILCAPARYNLAKVEHNGERLLTGFILGQNFQDQPVPVLNKFVGYSVPGVLERSDIPISSYPLQSDGLTLRQIATKLVTPFQITIDIDDDISDQMDIVYPKTTAEASQKVAEYLQQLCAQRNIILSHTASGHLLFTRAKADLKPIYHFEEGEPTTSITMNFNGDGMHNQITVIKQADKDGGNAGQSTVYNPYVPVDTTAFRPKVIIQNSGTDNDTLKCAQHELATELKNIVLTISTDRWIINGQVIKPNQVISVTSPKCYLYKKTNFFIESVNLSGSPTETTAVLTCVPVEVYNGQVPVNIFE